MAEDRDAQLRNRRKTDQDEKVRGIRIRVLNGVMIVLTCVFAIAFIVSAQSMRGAYDSFEGASENYIRYEAAANDLKDSSNILTVQARSYVVTQNRGYIQKFADEIASMRRENAVDDLREGLPDDRAVDYLEKSLQYSEELMMRERYAMALVADGAGQSLDVYGDLFEGVELSEADAALPDAEKIERGAMMLFDADYQATVDRINENVAMCKASLIEDVAETRDESAQVLLSSLFNEQVLVVALLACVVLLILAFSTLALRPLRVYIDHIRKNEPLPMEGAYELRFMAQAYNVLHDENVRTHDQLLRRAERDHLTDLYNRSVFEKSIDMHQYDPLALLLFDADYFKEVNDTLGHDAGDAMLKKISGLLMSSFRITDYPCRMGGDEFAVIMTEVTPDLKPVITAKIDRVRAGLRDTSDGLPVMTMSVGIAFSDGSLDSDELYKNADQALYKVKEAGRNGYEFYEG